MLDNSTLIAPFVPEKDDGDTFIYTEMLDRTARKGNNGKRLLKTFYHRSQEEFWEQWPTIKLLCDMSEVRAYTRLAPRSYEKVANQHLKMVVEAHVAKNHAGVKTLYNRALGTTSPNTKYWLYDVDVVSDISKQFGLWLTGDPFGVGKTINLLVAEIPSRKGVHYIAKPFNPMDMPRVFNEVFQRGEISLHKDNPTNLYIPEGAA